MDLVPNELRTSNLWGYYINDVLEEKCLKLECIISKAYRISRLSKNKNDKVLYFKEFNGNQKFYTKGNNFFSFII